MTSTGNDIVALKAINIDRTKQPQFYSKILSKSEKDNYDQNFGNHLPFEIFLWLSWSVKESAFKFLQRIMPELIFSPTRVNITHLELLGSSAKINFDKQIEQCGFDDETVYKGTVAFEENTLYFRSLITNDFICSIVNDTDDFANVFWGVRMVSSDKQSDQSLAVRKFLGEKLKRLFSNDNLLIGKSAHGYPVLLKDGAEIPIPVALAHHGYFVAYSIQIN